ncbi:MAG: hypothetical protein IJF29_03840 [Firmicutes bacterium]|nr:hypothetical protein [Bacillota bacterium]
MKQNKDIKVTLVEHIDMEDRFILKLKLENNKAEGQCYDDELKVKFVKNNKEFCGYINAESYSNENERILLVKMIEKLVETKNKGFSDDRHSFMTGWFTLSYAVEDVFDRGV